MTHDQGLPPDDPHARFVEAREIASARAEPDDLVRALALLKSSSADGCAEASEMLALFASIGLDPPQSWDRAFDFLLLAAGQGSDTARTQLLLLADPDSPPDPSATHDWAEVRASISIERLLAHGPRLALSEAPRIRVIESFLTKPFCDWLMTRAEPRLARATVLKKSGERGIAEGRSNDAVSYQVTEMDVVLEVVRTRISVATRVPVTIFEPTQVFRYAVGQEFKPHFDFFDPDNPSHGTLATGGQRIATLLIYLNEDFEGGDTEFPKIGLRFRGRKGDAIFWANLDGAGQPDPLTLHAGLPPTAGEKWILSQWIRDRERPRYRQG